MNELGQFRSMNDGQQKQILLNNLQQGKFDEFEMPAEPKYIPHFLRVQQQEQDLLDKLPKQPRIRNQSNYNLDLEKKDSEKTQAASDVTKVPTPKSKSIDEHNGSAWS